MKLLNAGKRNRHVINEGDLFVLKLADTAFLGGRVVKHLPEGGPMLWECYMVYIYKELHEREPTAEEVLEHAAASYLLTPPLFVSKELMHSGCAKVIGNIQLQASDMLTQHCFSSAIHDNVYTDENDKRLATRSEPCGVFAISPKLAIEFDIGAALGSA